MMGSIEYALEEVRLDEEGEVWVPSEADPTLERDSSTPYHIAPYQGTCQAVVVAEWRLKCVCRCWWMVVL